MAFAVMPVMARAGEKTPPAVLVRVQSLEAVIDNAKMLAALAGKEESARQMEALIKTKVGKNGLEGIDLKRPIGAYARLGKGLDDIVGALLVPIADEKSFLGLLENLNLNATKDDQGIYTVNTGSPVVVFFRFANKYVYVTGLSVKAIQNENLVAPADLFGAKELPTLSAAIRLDQIPDQARQLAAIQIESGLSKIRDEKKADETDLQRALRVKVAEETARQFKMLIEEGAEISAAVDIDAKTKKLNMQIGLQGKTGSALAAEISKLAESSSLFGGLLSGSNAMGSLFHLTIPEAVQPGIRSVIDEAMEKGLDRIGDAAKRKQAELLLNALAPTLKAGEIDIAFSLFGPSANKTYGMIGAIKLRDGNTLAKTMRSVIDEAAKDAPAAERERLKLDYATIGDVTIHRIDVQDKYDEKGKEIFGDHPVYVALRSDAALFAIGDGGFDALKKAVAEKAAKSPMARLEMSVAKLGPLMAKTAAQRAVVRRALDGKDDPRISVSVEGGSAMLIRVTADLTLVTIFNELKLGENQDQ